MNNWDSANPDYPDGFRHHAIQQDALPDGDDWDTADDNGFVFEDGSGNWDDRLGGMGTPMGVVKIDGKYYFYYIGASGDRGDGGPANRKVGMAYTTDPTDSPWTRSGNNPLNLTYNLPSTTNEAGVFAGGCLVDPDGTDILLYYGSMNEFSSGNVHCAIRLAVIDKDDGYTVLSDNQIIAYDALIQDGGDEIWPYAVYKDGSTWHMYYGSNNRNLCYVPGTAKDTWTVASSSKVIDKTDTPDAGKVLDCSVVDLDDGEGTMGMIVVRYDPAGWVRQTRTFNKSNPTSLSSVIDSYSFQSGTLYDGHEFTIRDIV